jgi:integrase
MDDQEKVFEFVPHRHRGIIKFLMVYGCRPSEACTLKKVDIDVQKREITIRGRKNGEDNTLPLLPEIEAILREPRKVQALEYVFSTAYGNPYMRQTVWKIWKAANQKAHEKYGIQLMALKNGTRHSKASQLINQNVSLETIARVLGNTPGVVEKAYGRVSVGRVAEVLKVAHSGHGRV